MRARGTCSAQLACFLSERFGSLSTLFGNEGSIIAPAIWSAGRLDCSSGGGAKYAINIDAFRTTRFTIEFELDVPVAIASSQVLMAVRSQAGNNRMTVALTTTGAVEISATSTIVSLAILSAGKHILHVVVANDRFTLYVDGTYEDSMTNALPVVAPWPAWLTLGIDYDGVANGFSGIVYRVHVFKAVFSATDVARAAATYTTSPSVTESLIAQFGGFWADPNYGSALTMAAQPTIADADCEASGTSAFTAYLATLSKSSSLPHGGSRCLQIAGNGGRGAYYAGAVIVGNTYAFSAWMRGDGTAIPAARIILGLDDWVGTASTSWQLATITAIAGDSNRPFFGIKLGGVAGTVAIDDIACANLSVVSITPRLRSGAFAAEVLANATAANQPWRSTGTINGRTVLQSADTDVLLGSLAASAYKFIHYGAAGALPSFIASGNLRVTSLAANTTLLRTYSAGTKAGIWIYVTTTGVVTVTWYDAAGGVLQTLTSGAGAVALNTNYTITAWADGTNAGVLVNGSAVIAATAMTFSPPNSDPANCQWLNGTTTPVVGQSSCLVLVAGYRDADSTLALHREQAAQWGIAA